MQPTTLFTPRTPREQIPREPYQACPLCSSKSMRPLRSTSCAAHPLWQPTLPDTIDWLECGECKHVFTSGYFGKVGQDILFSRTQESQQPGYDIERQREIAAAAIDKVIAVTGKREGRWLDVGCGAGALLTTAAEYGFVATGLDLRSGTVQVLQSMGYDVRCETLGASADGDAFDVVSLCDVLEHTRFPSEMLRDARSRLRDGVLLVSMPNSDSFVWKALDAAHANPYWQELEHYHNFSRASLYRLLDRHGFEPVSYGVSRRYRACMEVIARAA